VSRPHLVLGGGNGGLALAGDLALAGHAVRLFELPAHAEAFRPLEAEPRLVVRTGPGGGIARETTLALATTDLDRALDGARTLHLVVPVFAQAAFADLLLARLRGEHALVVWAGRFGGLHLTERIRREQGGGPRFTLIEANTLPYGARRTGPREVAILFRATRLFAAGLPEARGREVIAELAGIWPVLEPVGSMLEAAFRNSALPLLAVGALLNIGAIEGGERPFALFRDGLTAGVRRAVRAVYGEMTAVGGALGFALPAYPDEVFDGPASIEGANFRDEAGGTAEFLRLTGPDRLDHRYTVENVRYGLAVVAALGRRHGVLAPVIDAFVTLANALIGPEFARRGWTPDDLGLGGEA